MMKGTIRQTIAFVAAILLGAASTSFAQPGGGGDNILDKQIFKPNGELRPPKNEREAEMRRGRFKQYLFKECPELASDLVVAARVLADLQPPKLNRRGQPTRKWTRRNERAKKNRLGIPAAYCVLGCDDRIDPEEYEQPLSGSTFPDCTQLVDRAKFCKVISGKASDATAQLKRFIQKKQNGISVRPNKLEKLRRAKEDYAAFANRVQCPEIPGPN